MNKILLIIQREYLSRVRKKAFLVMTFAVPGLVLVAYALAFFLIKNKEGQDISIVNVADQSGVFAHQFKDTKLVKFTVADKPVAELKKDLKDNPSLFVLEIPQTYSGKSGVHLYSSTKPSLVLSEEIDNQMEKISNNDQMVKAHIDTAKLYKIDSKISIDTKQITAEGEKDAGVGTAMGFSIAGAILVYMSLFIYGAQVMRGVIEEKTNRIIEVIVSSVKPFQLMLGKIIGVGMVGLTQFLLWIVLSTAVTYVAANMFSNNKASVKTEKTTGVSAALQQSAKPQNPVGQMLSKLDNSNWGKELGAFAFYFLTGYLLYSALFAAVGSAVDSETETQQFMMPITMPLLFTYIISVTYLFQAPNSNLAVWLSMIPFTAPVVMMIRMPFDPPMWQIALSAFMMIVGFLFTTWVAARIYRVGILMYGKKTSYKEMKKWFFYKE
ncbi:ABC-2 type transport system permease protein [Mucilaginibacter yixingensis]|uniref:ABC-2 type transport system permease protein n=1 Tax=Mucilaginibacter yixingensis TaxID=1295612 RepID=A0A2T5J9X9_9SPHI|nr:ABC transporter permease [Mucilaginibacter yixingensis]PTQ96881.1 ABC-2 type transport system permease protein [Mucilaginibacter yixingensis]